MTVTGSPYIIAQSTEQANGVKNFSNITLGLYNPTRTLIDSTLVIQYGSTFSEIPGTLYLVQDNIKTVLPDPVLVGGSATLLSNIALKGASSSYCGIILQALASAHNTGGSTYDVTFTMSETAGMDGVFVLPVAPQTFNYTVELVITVNSTEKLVSLVVQLIDAAQPTSSSTSLSVTPSGSPATVLSTIVSDGVSTTLGGTGLSSRLLDYSKTNEYELVVSYPHSTTGSFTIGLAGSNSLNSCSKTVNFTL